jgi:hypothetical protein
VQRRPYRAHSEEYKAWLGGQLLAGCVAEWLAGWLAVACGRLAGCWPLAGFRLAAGLSLAGGCLGCPFRPAASRTGLLRGTPCLFVETLIWLYHCCPHCASSSSYYHYYYNIIIIISIIITIKIIIILTTSILILILIFIVVLNEKRTVKQFI